MKNPTQEQVQAAKLAATGDSLVIEAGAGTGKTSTLLHIAAGTDRTGTYIAFNKPIVLESDAKFAAQAEAAGKRQNVKARTAHSLAHCAIVKGNRGFQARLKGGRVRGDQIARWFGIDPLVITVEGEPHRIQPGAIASLAQKAINTFCNTADPAPTRKHIGYMDGIDTPDPMGGRTYENNNRVSAVVDDLLEAFWMDIQDPNGRLPFSHDHYLKMYQLSKPVIESDFIMFDEAQDASPVMLSIVEQQRQRGVQVIFVGDSQQSIYEWRGAVNALAEAGADHRTFLTKSFRFGHAIAGAANALLAKLNAELRIEGFEQIDSTVDDVANPDAILCRSNAMALKTVMQMQAAGRTPFLMGGGKEMLAFTYGAKDLMEKGSTDYADLACFTSWEQVLGYVENDPQGDELALPVKLIEDNGVQAILGALRGMPQSEEGADVVISTAHKAKGREWDTVKIASDFRYPRNQDGSTRKELSPSELRLLYVAVTRAKITLDPFDSESLTDILEAQEVMA